MRLIQRVRSPFFSFAVALAPTGRTRFDQLNAAPKNITVRVSLFHVKRLVPVSRVKCLDPVGLYTVAPQMLARSLEVVRLESKML